MQFCVICPRVRAAVAWVELGALVLNHLGLENTFDHAPLALGGMWLTDSLLKYSKRLASSSQIKGLKNTTMTRQQRTVMSGSFTLASTAPESDFFKQARHAVHCDTT